MYRTRACPTSPFFENPLVCGRYTLVFARTDILVDKDSVLWALRQKGGARATTIKHGIPKETDG
jgi:hypothetical protein